MLPALRFSSTPQVTDYLQGDDLTRSKLQDFERGGVAVGDPTQGLNVYTWEMRYVGRDFRIRIYPDGTFTSLFSWDGVQEMVFTFDQNMNPVVAFRVGDLWRLRWYDPDPYVQAISFTSLPGVRDVRLTLDEKRAALRDFSDVLIFYLKDNPSTQPQKMYMRAQKDRYAVEYAIGNLPTGTTAFDRVGMSQNSRLRFNLWGLYNVTASLPRPIAPFPPGTVEETGLLLDFRTIPDPYFAASGGGTLAFEFELYSPPVSDPF
jgi:hypothetical protein